MIRKMLREGLEMLRRQEWRDACPSGAPVPEPHRCSEAHCTAIPLTGLQPGDGGTVTCLHQPEDPHTFKLVALGILPGTRVDIVQRSPAFVLRVGYAELALDKELAGRVRIRPD